MFYHVWKRTTRTQLKQIAEPDLVRPEHQHGGLAHRECVRSGAGCGGDGCTPPCARPRVHLCGSRVVRPGRGLACTYRVADMERRFCEYAWQGVMIPGPHR